MESHPQLLVSLSGISPVHDACAQRKRRWEQLCARLAAHAS